MAADEEKPGSGSQHIHIGSAKGAFAFGGNSVANNYEAPPQQPTDEQQQLLQLVGQLREELRSFAVSPETSRLTDRLDETQGEIQNTGEASPSSLTRLRQALQDAATAVGLAASGAAVAQAVTALLGG
ncbi:hypothetical protein [Streptomyces sp. HD]|uniref:hypothetical protein n=1 Tax=Streptomyces sp. HD TaxID=3020892 RepID=UPI00232C2328|nr:hypothetical protein [Streptomyces sp. HD]MDC0766014.1 hypothetical protein [Streptomyces sp. HD]